VIDERSEQIGSLPARGGWEGWAHLLLFRCFSISRSSLLNMKFSLLLAGLSLAVWMTLAQAGSIEPKSASLTAGEDNHTLATEFDIRLGSRIEDVVTRGIAVYFNLELVIERPRKYWLPEHLLTRTLSYRLSYSTLTRQYRVNAGAVYQNFATLEEALRSIGRLVAYPVIERSALKSGDTYAVAVRLALDRSQLPKPFQVDAITDKEWQVDAKTERWSYTP
jgi:hypothetical protein